MKLKNPVDRTSWFWKSDRGLTGLLVVMLFMLFVLPAVFSEGTFSRLVFAGFFSLLLVSGVATVSGNLRARRIVTSLGIVAVAMQGAVIAIPNLGIQVADESLALLMFGILAYFVLVQVFREGPITIHRVIGSVVVYLLLGLVWAQAYRLVALFHPTAFSGIDPHSGQWQIQVNLSYYSFVTLTTTGFGDITPLIPAARSLTILEGLIGQLYPAILVARLVSMELMSRERP